MRIEANRVYEARRPAFVAGTSPLAVNDRRVTWVSADGSSVAYDSPSAPAGGYPTTTRKFRAWAARDITDAMPADGSWRRVR